MPDYIMNESNGKTLSHEFEEHYFPDKNTFKERSPNSPLTTQSPHLSAHSAESDSLDRAFDGLVYTSIEQLYNNVYEMQSSEHSPSRRSFLSYGEESRIDSELRFLAGGEYCGLAEGKNEVLIEKNGDITTLDEEQELKDKKENLEDSTKSSLKGKNFHGRPPNVRKIAKASKNEKSPLSVGKKVKNGGENNGEVAYLGPYLLKQARDMIALGDINKKNSNKALELALRAMKSFEISSNGKSNLDFVMCLHVVAALYCRLARYTEAISLLEKSIEIPDLDLGENHALAKFAGCMQLGDTYSILGQIENSIMRYNAGLEIQRQILGEKSSKFGETCRYLAEAYVQAMQFDEAEKLCITALEIHQENEKSDFLEAAADRRLLGLICDCKGEFENSLEHYVLASMAMSANGYDLEVAAIDCNIGDAYQNLARYDEAVFAYQKALNTFKSSKGENHSWVGSVFIRLADLYNKIGKFSEAKSYCENALRIYSKPLPGSMPEEVASGLVDISAVYESMNESDRAVSLLNKAAKIYGNGPGQVSTVAAIEAQIGVLYYILGNFSESYNSLRNAILKFRGMGEKRSLLFGITLNQLGLACVQLFEINEAVDLFEEAKSVLEAVCGPFHADTLGVYSNLAGAYDAMGRTSDAIEILEFVVETREEKLGTANSGVEDEKQRLNELLKEAGIVRNKISKSLKTLLVNNSDNIGPRHIEVS